MPLESLSPDTAYATKDNIEHPGTSDDATAAEARAAARLADAYPSLTVADSGAIKPES